MTETRAAYTLGDPRTETETCWDVFADGQKVGEICQGADGTFEIEMPDEEPVFESIDAALQAVAACCDEDDDAGGGDMGGMVMPRSAAPASEMRKAVPTDNIVRALWSEPLELRADAGGDGNTMVGHFAVFNRWTEIDSYFEGQFLERIAPGAFADTFKARKNQIRVLYDHGSDPSIGNKPLGVAKVIREDATGAYAEVEMFDVPYAQDLKPAIRAGQLGQSFRFRVTGEEWTIPKEPSTDNPNRLDERTITKVELYEFGPVTFPAYAGATVGLRSRTDEFWDRLLDDPVFVARFTERVGAKVSERVLAALPTDGRKAREAQQHQQQTSTDGDENDQHQRRADYFKRATAGFVSHISRLQEAS